MSDRDIAVAGGAFVPPMKPAEVALAIGCSRRHVYEMLESGELRGFKVGSEKGWRVRREELSRWQKAQEDKEAERIEKRNSGSNQDIGSQSGPTALAAVAARG